MSKRGLGKGIGSLIRDYSFDDVVQEHAPEGNVIDADITKVDANPDQPRKQFDEESLDELANSIREQGVLQPVLAIQQGDRYIVIAGERRLRAAKRAGLETLPVIVKSYDENKRLEIALIENLQRENLNPIEEAKAFRFLIDAAGISQDELSKRLGKRRSTIANSLRLLNLPELMQDALKDHTLTPGHARAVLSVVNPADQEHLFKEIVEKGLSVREAECRAGELNQGSRAGASRKKQKKAETRPPEIEHLEERFLEVLGTKVSIKGNLKKGKLEISYYSQEDLERIFEIIAPDIRLSDEL